MDFTSLNLLPQNIASILKDRNSKIQITKLLYKLYEISIEAINAFINREFYLFDAQVGETSCQIRAYKILHLSGSNDMIFNKISLAKELDKLISKKEDIFIFIDNLSKIISTKGGNYYKHLDAPISIFDYFNQQTFILSLSKDTIYIIQCYVLSKYGLRDSEDIPIAIDFKNIRCQLSISQNQAKRLIHWYQRSVAEDSCSYILQLTKNSSIDQSLRKTLPLLRQVAEEDRTVLPCYEVTKVLLVNALNNDKPILIVAKRYFLNTHIDTVCMLFIPSYESKNFVHQEYCFDDQIDQSCLVIKGAVVYTHNNQLQSQKEYIQRFCKLGVMNAVLYNMAKHPQYIGERLKWLSENPYENFKKPGLHNHSAINEFKNLEEELLRDKILAVNHGCCRLNQSMFYLKHIFCDIVGNQINNNTNNLSSIYTNQTRIHHEGLVA